jgi:hypothetical protein
MQRAFDPGVPAPAHASPAVAAKQSARSRRTIAKCRLHRAMSEVEGKAEKQARYDYFRFDPIPDVQRYALFDHLVGANEERGRKH